VRARSVAAAGCLAIVCALGAAGCGGGGGSTNAPSNGGNGPATLTIYSSLPLQGPEAQRSQSIVNAEKLALEEAHGRVGRFVIKFVSLDDADTKTHMAEPGQTAANARKAVQDPSTVAYIGELDSRASAISIPILNSAGILQVSPGSTYVGLTRLEGADKGEPDKYYPSGARTFGRVIPADHLEAAAQLEWQTELGCHEVYLVHDDIYGAGLTKLVGAGAAKKKIEVVGDAQLSPTGDAAKLANAIKQTDADCLFFGGAASDGAASLWSQAHAALPRMKLFGSAGLAEDSFTRRISPSAQPLTFLTRPTLPPSLYPQAGQKFFRSYRKAFGAAPDPYAIYGYEAMAVALQAIKNAGDRADHDQAVIDSFFQIKDRDSVLGTYSIDEHGDTTFSDFGGYAVRGGRLVFRKELKASV
jgi:branched-chain amino acid transport system substrate-binding protein